MSNINKNRKKYENNIILWLTVVGVPVALAIGIFNWLNLNIKIYLPLSILIGILFGLLVYIYLLKADIKDKEAEIKNLKRKVRKKQNVK